jgi:hypothetical protein
MMRKNLGAFICPRLWANTLDAGRTSRPEKSRSDFVSVLSTERAAQVLGSAHALPVGFPLQCARRRSLIGSSTFVHGTTFFEPLARVAGKITRCPRAFIWACYVWIVAGATAPPESLAPHGLFALRLPLTRRIFTAKSKRFFPVDCCY